MGLVPKQNLLPLKARNKSTYPSETNTTLTNSMPDSGIQGEELVISSKKPASMHLVPKSLFDSLPLKYAGQLRNSWQGTKPGPAVYSLFDKLKRRNTNSTGEYSKVQWNSMWGSPRGTSFSDLCKAGKLSVKFNRSCYAACLPKQSGRSQRSTKLMMGCYGNQGKMCIQDIRAVPVPGLLCIGVEHVICCGTDFIGDVKTSDPSLPLELHAFPSESDEQSRDDDKTGRGCGLTTLLKLDLPRQKHPSSSSAILLLSSDPPQVQSANDPSVIINKSEQQHSPLSVLEQLFEEASPRQANSTSSTKPVKPPIQPLHINFEERSPVKRFKLHSNTITRTSITSKKHTSSAAEYTRKVLEASKLDWYQLALKWPSSTQMLNSATDTKIDSMAQEVTQLEAQLLFDHVNEVLLDIYQPYYGFYTLMSLSRPPNKLHIVTERNFMDEVIKIVETNLILGQQNLPTQKLIMNAMEKCGTWIDIRSELEDMVLEIVEEVAEELVEEFVFDLWIED